MRAADIARALGGRRSGARWMCKCVSHDDRSPSLGIVEAEDGKVLVRCYAGCDQQAVIAELARRGLWPGREGNYRPAAMRSSAPPREHRKAEDDAERIRRALAIWSEAEPIAFTGGAIASRYLVQRGVDLSALPNEMEHVLRWHPRCPWGPGNTAPCMLALWTDTITGAPKAIHRTLLTAEAEKIGRLSFGPTAGCVIRLWPDDFVERGLVIGEGIETVLAAATRIEHKGTRLTPAWACGDAGHVGAFPVLAGIEALTILVDHDESGTGQTAAADCAERWQDAGREVTRLTPRIAGDDFNDIVEVGG